VEDGRTISHERADLELDALANREPVKGVSDEIRYMIKLRNAPQLTPTFIVF